MRYILVVLLAGCAFASPQENGRRFDEMAARCQRLLHAWLKEADPKTLLMPDRVPGRLRGLKPGDTKRLYTPHNSGADLYPYLILTAHLTDPDLYHGRMMQMLRNEVLHTGTIPGSLELTTGQRGEPSIFGAAEYAKDGLVAVTELLGRTPWFYRMADMTAAAMETGKLPAPDAETNGDMLQTLIRLATMTGDARYLNWARQIGDFYVEKALPANHGLPATKMGLSDTRLRDHGNETVVGLTLLYALEHSTGSPHAARYEPAVRLMLDRILKAANPDGMLPNSINAETLAPVDKGISDNWGYVYGAVYTFYQCNGEEKYRDAVRHVLKNLPKYRNFNWESGSFDGYADSIESALYLVAREPVPEALDWIESEIEVMARMQQPDGHVENWYGEGNFNRTLLLYMFMKSQGVRPDRWVPGVRVGAVREGDSIRLSLEAPKSWTGKLRFDYARHRREINLTKNFVRLNEWPEWFTVDENTLYRLRSGKRELILLGSEMIAGVRLEPGEWTVERYS